ncbi:propionyl-CoA--succinate CoA transferase [Mycobacterium dioxanotrophicus]|jgi:acyl-CoA hydrolase|uniref:Propionyl-CoA--succinate CoA transferase n=1 Tax=Mycobacterium dioxanotrophicus TaxID=482462 RepID=A0A1Y0C471_9MYCO|nr:acetyl-CoA hydrolase/transferase C-terminal domain-containing protein [Mycobacterium dioxanotrophicus]ART69979.1 propionyl-CoA--succinate CoA transferase [Mycobacterium dioxanotrophicus]
MTSSVLPKAVPPEAVLEHIKPGADIVMPNANGEAVTLVDTLEEHADQLDGVRIHQMHALRERRYINGEFGDHLRHVSYFLAPATRKAYAEGKCDLVPNHFSEVPDLIRRSTNCSLVIAAASPPNRHGYFSLGTNCDYTASLIGRVPFFLEANRQMPRTFGGNQVHVSQIAGWTEVDYPLVEAHTVVPTDKDRAIAAMVAERIPDRATLQAGIGGMPNALLAMLKDHKDLGVHTELLSDGVIDLVESGVVTGTHKHYRRGKIVTTLALGSQRLYDFLHENSAVDFAPVDWVNNPRVIAQEPNFVSINATTEVDFFGQCASETVGGRYFSSSGGQYDFARGAMYSEGGQGFIVLQSTTRDGSISKIRPTLSPGSVVTTSKNTVDKIVTEYGVAEMRGKTLRERATALISIADPKFRDELTAAAKQLALI